MKISLLYILALLCYGVTFFLFLRLLFWKKVSQKYFWKGKPAITLSDLKLISAFEDTPLPFISILVPAKNESAVIRQTIVNALHLDYPSDKYELGIVVDERETIENDQKVQHVWSDIQHLRQTLCLKQDSKKKFVLKSFPKELQQALLLFKMKNHQWGSFYHELFIQYSSTLSYSYDPSVLHALKSSLEEALKRIPHTQKEVKKYVMISLQKQFPKADRIALKQMMQPLQETIFSFVQSVGWKELENITKQDVQEAFPTTKTIAEGLAKDANQLGVALKIISVPLPYTGTYPRTYTTDLTHSTKGRALNYAIDELNPSTDIVGFYDAESRPDQSVLLHVAHRYLQKKEKLPILQGPLYQVRNYYTMGFVSRIGGLFKAVSHEWYLPIIFKKIPFVGGTNLFVPKSLLLSIQGFNPVALTEDLDLGIRAYTQRNVSVEFLPVVSTEQTPPKWNQFFKQRLRWASGHLQVMTEIKRTHPSLYWQLFWKGPFEWMLYQFSALVVILMNFGFIFSKLGWIPNHMVSVNPTLQMVLLGLNIPYVFFSFYCFYHYQFTFEKHFLSLDSFPGVECIKLVISSILVFLLPLPYIWALILHVIDKKPIHWVKTPRTAE
ncbi:MAG TPA: glycosyltransferase family 2 protein [Caldisericia bacterium]|nr:glycosyltransferase family 2 protein [Caldisericia bacterium]HXK51442.1 glycosyltransferase family 2 protein [Caldisericia bacterium]